MKSQHDEELLKKKIELDKALKLCRAKKLDEDMSGSECTAVIYLLESKSQGIEKYKSEEVNEILAAAYYQRLMVNMQNQVLEPILHDAEVFLYLHRDKDEVRSEVEEYYYELLKIKGTMEREEERKEREGLKKLEKFTNKVMKPDTKVVPKFSVLKKNADHDIEAPTELRSAWKPSATSAFSLHKPQQRPTTPTTTQDNAAVKTKRRDSKNK